MIIKDISVENFRCINKLTIKDLGLINLFVGDNNIGKTSLLEALFLLVGMSNPSLAVNIDRFRNLLHTDGDDFRFIFHRLDYRNIPKLEGTLYNREVRSLSITAGLKLPGTEKVVSTSGSSLEELSSLVAESLTFDFSSKMPHSPKESQKATITFSQGSIQTTPPKNYKEKISGIFMSSNFNSRDLTDRLEALLVEKRKEEIITGLQLIDPNITDISTGKNGLIYLDVKGIDRLIPSNLQGTGLNRLIGIVVNLYSIKNGILIIDEIENGFHFKVLQTVWETIIKAAHHYNVQIFVSTHNYEALQEFQKAIKKLSIEDIKVSVYKLIRDVDRNLNVIMYTKDQIESAIYREIEIR